MEFNKLTEKLYQENINWIYSIIKELDVKGIERKEKFIANVYTLNNMIELGYYFMNLYVISNLGSFKDKDTNYILNAIVKGASSYNVTQLKQIFKSNVDLEKIIEQYNSIVRKTKAYAPNDGLKARVVAVDEVYRRIYNSFNKRHFNIFVKVFMTSFPEYEKRINNTINECLNEL